MPYIPKVRRELMDGAIALITRLALPDGEVNYVITKIIDSFYGAPLYAGLNAGLGVLEAVKQEFYRRRVIPFEEEKAKLNGEVYE